jgi:hypothetical protein
MALAGELAVPPLHKREPRTSSSGTFTAETVVDTITADLVTGKEYEIRWTGLFQSSVAADVVNTQLREDSISGTRICDGRTPCTTANKAFAAAVRGFYTAVATGSKTFVVTGVRDSGTGNITAAAVATSPAVLTIDQVS